MRVVERTRRVGTHAEMQRLHACRSWVGAVVRGGQELGTAEANLDVVCGGGENRGVVDCDFNCFVGGSVELGRVSDSNCWGR